MLDILWVVIFTWWGKQKKNSVLLDKFYKILFFIGLFFIPFNAWQGIPFLGEFRHESAIIFFLGGALIMFFSLFFGQKVTLPLKNPIFQVFLVFIAWCFVATLLNLPSVWDNYFKQTGGVNRFFRQFVSLILSSLVLFTFYWNVLRKMSVKDILLQTRKVFLWSLIVASVYGFLEILIVYFGMDSIFPILNLFNYFPFLEVDVYGDRISSVAQEPPYLAIYLMTIAGWMFSYIITSDSIKKYIPILLVLILTFFSGSRTALVVISFQIVVFLFLLLFSKKQRKFVFILVGSAVLILSILVALYPKTVISEIQEKAQSLNFKSNLTESVSNKTRIGIQAANIQVIEEHPVIGVGFGQQTYHNRFHYPVWATYNNYEFDLVFKNKFNTSFPPGYNMYLRIMAETGIIGIGVFLFFLFLILKKTLNLMRNSTGEKRILAAVLFISFIGGFINWLQIDSFRLYGFWIFLAILIHISVLPDVSEEKVESEV